MKICCRCKLPKDETEFNKNSSKLDGLQDSCRECQTTSSRRYQEKNRDSINKKNREYCLKNRELVNKKTLQRYHENKDSINERKRSERLKDPEKYRQYIRDYYANNKDVESKRKKDWVNNNKDKSIESKRKWKRTNPDLVNMLTAERRALKKMAQPKWLTKFDKQYVRHIYRQAVELTRIYGEQYEVDHIVPLVNKNVCGLHVPWNLQILTRSENAQKSNKII